MCYHLHSSFCKTKLAFLCLHITKTCNVNIINVLAFTDFKIYENSTQVTVSSFSLVENWVIIYLFKILNYTWLHKLEGCLCIASALLIMLRGNGSFSSYVKINFCKRNQI